jgi:hypothetical protein
VTSSRRVGPSIPKAASPGAAGRFSSLGAADTCPARQRGWILQLTLSDAQVLRKEGTQLSIFAESGIYGRALSYRVEGAVTLRHGADFVAHTTSSP